MVPSPNGLFLTQDNYIYDIVKKFNMQDSKSVSTPMFTLNDLAAYGDTHSCDAQENHQLIGSL
uniref:Retrovirus-related Pol polyprotein from transposon TNT 1-94 n=1 Tax=Cajanus cajan TaxID=3821 RepID=A0A151RU40_CAJCA|nr:hypothetical protein KK1_032423 [Cajanus cajan]